MKEILKDIYVSIKAIIKTNTLQSERLDILSERIDVLSERLKNMEEENEKK